MRSSRDHHVFVSSEIVLVCASVSYILSICSFSVLNHNCTVQTEMAPVTPIRLSTTKSNFILIFAPFCNQVDLCGFIYIYIPVCLCSLQSTSALLHGLHVPMESAVLIHVPFKCNRDEYISEDVMFK